MPSVIPRTRSDAERLISELRSLIPSLQPIRDNPGEGRPNLGADEQFSQVVSRKKPLEVWNGSVCVKIYAVKWRDKKRRKLYRSYELRWVDAGQRFRQKKSKLQDAKKSAEQIAGAISTGETNRLQFSQADVASLLRCRELLGPVRVGLELAVSKFVDWIKTVGSPGAVDHALQFFQEHQPKDVVPRNVPELAEDMLADKRNNGRGEKWLKELAGLLKFWTGKFNGPIYSLRSPDIKSHLNQSGLSLRTRKNRLAALRELSRFAQSQGQLPRSWNELSLVGKIELRPVEVESYTPEQLVRLLDAARANLVPLIVLQAFGGVRHEEVQKMDWRDINLKSGFIKIKSVVAKTKKMRLIEMQPNLIAWLRIYAKSNGPICTITHTSNALVRTKQRASLPAGRGELTNALRSGFGSHRLAQCSDIGLVAQEMGNSPNIIKQHYLELVTPDEAKRWFNIWPKKHANIIDWDKSDLPFDARSHTGHLDSIQNQSPISPQQKTAS